MGHCEFSEPFTVPACLFADILLTPWPHDLMIDSKQLLSDLQKRVRFLEDDLRARCEGVAEVGRPLRRDYESPPDKGRTSLTYNAWRDEDLTQVVSGGGAEEAGGKGAEMPIRGGAAGMGRAKGARVDPRDVGCYGPQCRRRKCHLWAEMTS